MVSSYKLQGVFQDNKKDLMQGKAPDPGYGLSLLRRSIHGVIHLLLDYLVN